MKLFILLLIDFSFPFLVEMVVKTFYLYQYISRLVLLKRIYGPLLRRNEYVQRFRKLSDYVFREIGVTNAEVSSSCMYRA